MNYGALILCLWGLSGLALASAESPGGVPEVGSDGIFQTQLQPFLAEFCVECHGQAKQKAEVNFEVFGPDTRLMEQRKYWTRVREVLMAREMPPDNRLQPAEAERERVVQWIESELAKFDCSGPVSPGRVTLRRLNRVEYRNTVRDLVGVDFDPAADFPVDEVGYGFDNIGDVLSLPPMLMEKYLAAAELVAAEAAPGVFRCAPDHGHDRACARESLERLARRAYRRPLQEGEVDRLMGLFDLVQAEGGTVAEGVEVALQAMLVSPRFLFRWELDPEPELAGGIRALNDHELASRLSYFLWSSMPDHRLFDLADRGELGRPEVLEAEAGRMVQDPKAWALVENFGGQWLQIRNLAAATPDAELFPEFDDALREAMRMETELFFEAVMKEDRSVLEFIDADFTFLNRRLARHYGLDEVEGDQFEKVHLDPGSHRGGILTHASILTITSNPTRTSPVNRGKWILEQVLGAPPPPPPPNVPPLEEGGGPIQAASLRQRMELHRAKPECATCHTKMDAMGFAFENFDAVGKWRDRDGSFPIDPAGTLPTGQTFQGPAELKALLKTDPAFVRSLAEKMLTFALGRGLEYYDQCAVDDIEAALLANGHRFSALISGIVKSHPFCNKTVGTPGSVATAVSHP